MALSRHRMSPRLAVIGFAIRLAIASLAGCAPATATAPLSGKLPAGAPAHVPSSGAVQISISEGHACARMVDGTVRCWGDNGGGELGDGSDIERHTPVPVKGIAHAVDIASTLGGACAQLADRTVWCWGSPGFIRIDEQQNSGRALAPSPALALDRAETLWIGEDDEGCARWQSGTTRCWGSGSGFLAAGHRGKYGTSPEAAQPSLDDATEFSLGESLGCARMEDGTARCWGRNEHGQVGDGTTILRMDPVAVLGLRHVAQIVAARESACARLDDGTVRCWGSNDAGQLGDGTTIERHTPVEVRGVHDVVQLAAGAVHMCARHGDGTLTCWGWNRGGQLGRGSNTETESRPAAVKGLDRVIQVVATLTHTCALRDDGAVFCWGLGWRGVLGDGTQLDHNRPVQVAWSVEQRASVGLPRGVHVTNVAVGFSHSCAALSDGSVRCWGHNDEGQVDSIGDEPAVTIPTVVRGISNVAALSLETGSFALRGDGTLVSWGAPKGIHPVGLTQVAQYVRGAMVACVRHTDHSATCMRDDVPVTIAGVVQVSTSHAFGCVVLGDGTVSCMGTNSQGELGDGTTTDRATFAPVAGLSHVAQISVGFQHACARLTDGSVQCWGQQTVTGGRPSGAQRSPVTMVGGDVVDLASGSEAACARRRDGSVWCWGAWGHSHEAGAWSEAPIEVPWLRGAKQLALGMLHSCALLADDRVVCWGDNQFGQLGDGTMDGRTTGTPVRW